MEQPDSGSRAIYGMGPGLEAEDHDLGSHNRAACSDMQLASVTNLDFDQLMVPQISLCYRAILIHLYDMNSFLFSLKLGLADI